jgi:predicted ATP-binding protein involved in virulence
VYRSYREDQILAIENGVQLDESTNFFAQAIHVVKSSVNCLITEMTGWRDIAYSAKYHQQLVLSHPEQGTLPLEMLSDGLRNMVAMVADLAFRAFKLNPHLKHEAAKQTQGIVLIDEVDMFLHPSWQQTVLRSLQNAFPKIQFIVTTHSPQVLTTVAKKHIRVITLNDNIATAREPDFSPLAHESGDALTRIMGTHREPEMPLQDSIRRYELLVRSGLEDSDNARNLRQELESAGYEFHGSDLTTWRFLASRRMPGGQTND